MNKIWLNDSRPCPYIYYNFSLTPRLSITTIILSNYLRFGTWFPFLSPFEITLLIECNDLNISILNIHYKVTHKPLNNHTKRSKTYIIYLIRKFYFYWLPYHACFSQTLYHVIQTTKTVSEESAIHFRKTSEVAKWFLQFP